MGNPLLAIVEAIARAWAKAWFEEMRRQREVKVVGGGSELADVVNEDIDSRIGE
jgi:hypothetical protein